jgi:hypothetical protein
MYFTMTSSDSSRVLLAEDAWHSLAKLRSEARALGGLTAFLNTYAKRVMAAYQRALVDGGDAAWIEFVRAADELASYGRSVAETLRMDDSKREAVRYFESIARENADLLPVSEHAIA